MAGIAAFQFAFVLAVALALWRLDPRLFRWFGRTFGKVAARRRLSVALVGVLGFASSALLTTCIGVAEPQVHDEFSYLLAADTFATGRLTNPPHPCWVHFESFHINQQPTYCSMYPPAQGVVLAVGRIVGGHPIIGVWLSVGLAGSAICWMMQAWVPPRWALLGGVLGVLIFVFRHYPLDGWIRQIGYWSQSYWGGAVAAAGGALTFGALRRLADRRSVGQSALLGFGLAVVANSRPFEGFVVGVPLLLVLIKLVLNDRGGDVRQRLKVFILPAAGVLVGTAAFMAYYNVRTTGHALVRPYDLNIRTYYMARMTLLLPANPPMQYHNPTFTEYHYDWALPVFSDQQTFPGLMEKYRVKLKRLWGFYLGVLLSVALVGLPWAVKDRWTTFALATCLLLVWALLQMTWMEPHYVAPVAGLIMVLVVQGMRQVRVWKAARSRVGRFLVLPIPLTFAVVVVLQALTQADEWPPVWSVERRRVWEQLDREEGRHLVLVQYGPRHSVHEEWVYNEADINASRIVWARFLDETQNAKLLRYFRERQAWLLTVDGSRVDLAPLVVPVGATQGEDGRMEQ